MKDYDINVFSICAIMEIGVYVFTELGETEIFGMKIEGRLIHEVNEIK